MNEPTITDALEGRRRSRPRPLTVEKAQKIYEAHIPSMVTHVCMACFGATVWPCPPYREARATLILGGRLQDGPVEPTL